MSNDLTSQGAMHFFAQLSSSELKMSAQVRKYLVHRMLKRADDAKKCIAPDFTSGLCACGRGLFIPMAVARGL